MPESRQELRTNLQNKLRELFQFDVSDLDFGIYRILNRKRDEIEEFIKQDLLDAIEEGLKEFQKGDRNKFEAQLKDAKSKIPDKAFEENGKIKEEFEGFEDVERYKEAVNALESLSVSEEIEKRIYQDLYTFFSRYYDDGDFLTQRRISTRNSKYAIPYNGEEVKLHWANKDQYYIKSGEYFTDYKFQADGLDFWFRIQRAETEKDNVKENDSRYFILRPDNPIEIDEDEGELTIWFEYRPLKGEEEERWLKVYNKVESSRKTLDRQALCIAFDEWVRSELTGKWRDVLSKILPKKARSLLYAKLNHYTGKNTTDYFIHKNLQDFLERELEYYLKHEVIRVDDFIEADSDQPMKAALTRAKVVRGIGQKIITFLSQIENFQKKLFEKKKFVVDTHYCVTLDKVPNELYENILENEQQLDYWEECYSMDEWEKSLEWNGEWTEATLQSHPYMMVDTKFFEDDFKYKLLAYFDDLDEEMGGILFKGENFQAINTIKEKFYSSVQSIYLDPPYNTNASEIIYKNNYKHSSWLSLIENRLQLTKDIMKFDSVLCITIDHVEFHRLRSLIGEVFDEENILGVISIKNNPSGRSTVKGLSIANEFAIFVGASSSSSVGNLPRTEKQLDQYPEEDEKGRFQWRYFLRSGGANDFRSARPRLHYPLFVKGKNVRIPKMSWDAGKRVWRLEEDPKKDEEIVYPKSNGEEYTWRLGIESLSERIDELRARESSRANGLILEIKFRLDESGVLPKTVWDRKNYNATSYGTSLLRNFLGESQAFSFPKSVYAVEDSLRTSNLKTNDFVIDYFAGSGTTGHAVLNLNKEDNGNRKYILVEMGTYFNTVLKPRLKKVVFSENWKDGIPQDKDGQSHAFKYHFIESYEDALNNIDFRKKEDTQKALEFEDYLIKYMLDFETQGASPSLLKDEAFKTPFDYTLKIQRGHETPKEEKVDLVETLHYLIGLWVQTIRKHDHQDRQYIISKGEIRSEEGIEVVLVVWRNTEVLDLDKEAEWLKNEIIEDQTFDRIYINGASKIKGAEPTEITFRDKMFEEVA